jgi:hypothetical protein
MLSVKQGTEVLHVSVKGIDWWFCPAAIPMPPQIYGQYPTTTRQDRSNKIKPVSIGAAAVDKD